MDLKHELTLTQCCHSICKHLDNIFEFSLQNFLQEMVRHQAEHVAAPFLRGYLRGLPRHRRLGNVVLRDQQREHAQARIILLWYFESLKLRLSLTLKINTKIKTIVHSGGHIYVLYEIVGGPTTTIKYCRRKGFNEKRAFLESHPNVSGELINQIISVHLN